MDTVASGSTTKLGSTAVEEILCGVSPIGLLADLIPHNADAWSVEYPGLDALPPLEGEPARLRICISTEDIVGPVRNGGIGTTYAALAELLAGLGHDVTILYLKGHEVENGTIEHWIDFYAAKSVRFVPVPNYAATDRFQTGADRWLHGPYNMLRYLTDNPMDVVHVSEWRGSGYLSLLAKRQGLAFHETLFIVKTSSPWIWNRLYGSQPLDRLDDLAKVQAERRSVEFADMVIGGSLHLLRWMSSQGYKIPRQRTFVQPNVATFDHLRDLMNHRSWERGKRYPVDEIVFFGRLEARKGLFIFVQAVKRLLRQGKTLPPQITFMGKPGARLTARPDQDIVDYIKSETEGWPTKVEILSEYQQYEALQYLLGGNRLAVMPSVIENSSLAVYEAAICGIPFIASATGGTPELVASIDHSSVLCEAHPIPVADMISDALEQGGYVARPSFDNDANLEKWRRFHLDLGRGLLTRLLPDSPREMPSSARVSVCIYYPGGDQALFDTLISLKEQDHPAHEVLIAIDGDDENVVEKARATVAKSGLAAELVPAFDLDAGGAYNLLSKRCEGDFLFFLWSGSTIKPLALRALTKVIASSDADLVNYFFRVTHEGEAAVKDYLSAIIFGSVAQTFFRTDVTSLPLLVRRHVFAELGGFTSDYRVLAHDHELVAKAQISGVHCETALLELGTVPAWNEQWLRNKCYDQSIAQFRAIRPELAATPLAMRELLLMAKGLQKSPPRRNKPAVGGKSKKVDARLEGPIGRLMTALSPDSLIEEPASPPVKQAPLSVAGTASSLAGATSANVPKQKKANASRSATGGAGLMRLIDELSMDDFEVEAKDAPKPVVREKLDVRPRVTDPRPAVKRAATRRQPALQWLSTAQGKRFTGHVFGVYEGSIYGWIRDEDHPDDPVEIEAVVAGKKPQFFRANVTVPVASPLSEDRRGRGFIVPVWTRWRGLPWDKRSKKVTLRVKDTNVIIGEFSIMANDLRIEDGGFDGYCDLMDATVRGWVWRPSTPHEAIDVSVFVDGRFFARTTASSAREDLRASNIGSGAYGFAVSLPRELRDGTPHQINVVISEAGLFLKFGKLRLVGDSLTIEK